MAAAGRWPPDAPVVVPGVPGPAGADRDTLLRRLATSRRLIERASRSIAGHELARCPLEHPLVGSLRCGEWFLFAGVHDLMHLGQLAALAAGLAAPSSGATAHASVPAASPPAGSAVPAPGSGVPAAGVRSGPSVTGALPAAAEGAG
jgi:hypothetical protein